MTNPGIPFDDDLATLLGLPAPTPTVAPRHVNPLPSYNEERGEEEPAERPVLHLPAQPQGVTCTACHGSGIFHSYSGRAVGECFRCKGTGRMTHRQVGAQKAMKTRETNKIAKLEAFKVENADVYGWLVRNAPSFEFAGSLLRSLTEWGSLTEKQLETAQRLANRESDRNAERAAKRAAQPAPVVQRTIDPDSDCPF